MVAEDSILPASRPVVRLLGWMGPHKKPRKKRDCFLKRFGIVFFYLFLNEKIVIAVTNLNQIGYPTLKYFMPLTYFLCNFQITQVTFVAKHF